MIRAVAALFLLAIVQSGPAEAIEPRTAETVVLRNKVFDGFIYQDAIVPSQVGTFTLLAGVDNALTVTQTLEYYWPLSRQFYAAFDKLDEPLKGRLQITQGGRTILDAAPENYVIVYPKGTTGPGAHMVWGEDAARALSDYKAQMLDYNRRASAAQQDRQRYDRDLKAAAIARVKGQVAAEVSPPSSIPDPMLLFVTDLAAAYRVNLPAGQFSVCVVEDDLVVEGSTRSLDVIVPSVSSAVTIDIVPEERWTRVLPSNTAGDVIYSAPGKTFYAVLNQADRFDEKAYRSLVDPQGFGQAGREFWVRRGPAMGKRLDVQQADGSWLPVQIKGYKVRQTQGAQLGYVIEPTSPDETPDISAYEVQVPPNAEGHQFGLRVVDETTGMTEPGAARDVVLVTPASAPSLWMAATGPLLIGLLSIGFRRWRQRS